MNLIDSFFRNRTQVIPARQVSRPVDYYLPAIAAGARFEFSIFEHLPEMRRYMPLNWFELYNPSTASLSVRIESVGGELFLIAADSSRIVRTYFNNLIITNTGAINLAANTAILTLQKV